MKLLQSSKGSLVHLYCIQPCLGGFEMWPQQDQSRSANSAERVIGLNFGTILFLSDMPSETHPRREQPSHFHNLLKAAQTKLYGMEEDWTAGCLWSWGAAPPFLLLLLLLSTERIEWLQREEKQTGSLPLFGFGKLSCRWKTTFSTKCWMLLFSGPRTNTIQSWVKPSAVGFFLNWARCPSSSFTWTAPCGTHRFIINQYRSKSQKY